MPDSHIAIVELTRAGAADLWFGEVDAVLGTTAPGTHLHVVFPPVHDFWGCVAANLGGCFGMVSGPVPDVYGADDVFTAVAGALSTSGRSWTWSTRRSARSAWRIAGIRRAGNDLRERLGRLQPS